MVCLFWFIIIFQVYVYVNRINKFNALIKIEIGILFCFDLKYIFKNRIISFWKSFPSFEITYFLVFCFQCPIKSASGCRLTLFGQSFIIQKCKQIKYCKSLVKIIPETGHRRIFISSPKFRSCQPLTLLNLWKQISKSLTFSNPKFIFAEMNRTGKNTSIVCLKHSIPWRLIGKPCLHFCLKV